MSKKYVDANMAADEKEYSLSLPQKGQESATTAS